MIHGLNHSLWTIVNMDHSEMANLAVFMKGAWTLGHDLSYFTQFRFHAKQ